MFSFNEKGEEESNKLSYFPLNVSDEEILETENCNNPNDLKLNNNVSNEDNFNYKKTLKLNNNNKENTTKFSSNENKEILREKEIKSNEKKEGNDSLNKKNKLGRKRKSSNDNQEEGKHTKYSKDNIIRKIKNKIISILSEFINKRIADEYKNKKGKGIFEKKLLKMNQQQIIDQKNNKQFLNKTLQDIFSNDVTNKCHNYNPKHNKLLVEGLINEKETKKQTIFKKIFSLTFLDCLKHFREKIIIDELNGMKSLDSICQDLEDDQDYVKLFRYYVLNFENIIMGKKNEHDEL